MRRRIVLLARAPRAGAVKTRLAAVLGEPAALALYRAFLVDQLVFLGSLAGDHAVEWCTDAPPEAELAAIAARETVRVTRQVAGDLGARLAAVFVRGPDRPVGPTVVVGADSPTLPARLVRQAFARLGESAEAVLVPAEDGGYVLIGLRDPVPAIFEDVPWGGANVLERTRERARVQHLALAELEPWYDVDDGTGLARLVADLREPTAARRAPRTRRAILDLSLDPMV